MTSGSIPAMNRCPRCILKEQVQEVGTGQRLRMLCGLFWCPLSNHLPSCFSD